ncbi:MAG TPA: NAD-dependent epimerase/dehydratase family protein, partial [Burkholderiaceae bacterium]|nr:NAD-dependent epimerase/dehydratase family protein [Burkholderiaceae bacterium]
MHHGGVVLITGSSGFIGRALVDRLSSSYRVVCLDRHPAAGSIELDVASDDSVRAALDRVRVEHGPRIASVVHLAAYFDLTGEPNPKYEEVTVRGTERLLLELRARFAVEQFIFASTMLVHAAGRPGERIDESRPLDPKLPYRASKIRTEQLLRAQHGDVPIVLLRPAGVYDDLCSNPFLAHQIARIYERRLKSRLYSGDLDTGQSFVHLDDLADAVERLVQRRAQLPAELPLLVGEPEALSYRQLQRDIGCLIHGEAWNTWQVAPPVAKAGAWLQDEVVGGEPFIKPWMVGIANDHYELDVARARTLLDWEPKHRLQHTLPAMVASLQADPVQWYRANRLDSARVAGRIVEPAGEHRAPPGARWHAEQPDPMHEHMAEMDAMRLSVLWVHWVVIALGAWLLTSPWQFALFDAQAAGAQLVRDVTAERGLWDPALRNALTGWSDVASGLLLIVFGTLSLSKRLQWAQWGTTAVGLWLLFAPLVFWTPSAAAYMNDTLIGALAIVFSVLVPMMPGMSHEGMMDRSTVPAGWSYSPSSWLQRLPIIALGFFGFLIARYLASYQLGHIDRVWEPFFATPGTMNGTEFIITSEVSRAWPIADAGLGATAYLLEALMGAMGGAARWRTMPWMVTFFFILVVPLGGISIFFIIIQPIMIGTYCTLCLIAAAGMLLMIPLAIDEVIAMGQYLLQARRAGRPLLRTFLQGGPSPEATAPQATGFDASPAEQWRESVRGVAVPWPLVASCALGAWMMFTPLVIGATGSMADSNHLIGALVITVAVTAMA